MQLVDFRGELAVLDEFALEVSHSRLVEALHVVVALFEHRLVAVVEVDAFAGHSVRLRRPLQLEDLFLRDSTVP